MQRKKAKVRATDTDLPTHPDKQPAASMPGTDGSEPPTSDHAVTQAGPMIDLTDTDAAAQPLEPMELTRTVFGAQTSGSLRPGVPASLQLVGAAMVLAAPALQLTGDSSTVTAS